MSSGETADEDDAHEFAVAFGRGQFTTAVGLLSEDGHEQLVASYPDQFQDGELEPTAALEAYWRGLYNQYGEFVDVGAITVDDADVMVELCFVDGVERATLEFDEDGVADLEFDPAYEVPDYVDHGAFSERNVMVDTEDSELAGVLAVPDSDCPVPGVVLVHGHGIHDPNGTVGATKILRDLAWGLASNGIATLRYEKRLNSADVPDDEYTLDTVVTDDAVAAMSTLADADDIAADSVFVAGHSQGGLCAPRIASRYGDAAGVVVLDGTADPVVDPDNLTWLRYSLDVDGVLDDEQEAEFEAMRETFRRIADCEFEPDETIRGFPGVWHQSHHDYDPVGTASDLAAPTFVLKTDRTDPERQPELAEMVRDHYETWQSADLPPGSRTEYYEGIGHYFQPGPAPVTQTRLFFGGNVADAIIEDITEWVLETQSRATESE
ncbi:hypothetical protein C482_13354 [Natrialba chahannaoensis JCM 10990]|uniref:AB hydrolase-1 domain-containing protein n=1 Tax=Natrialba chahannaoensis JCM 10990 TaxID=1227492 RepID=M0AI88_9EURY|nr:alpha/beta hydrolase [Natrialba chahannaoensis]ELY97612.1 hypothetical protein C482_13354 [Natrialba chahannaoensis JCM 10990]